MAQPVIGPEEEERVLAVLRSGRLSLGPVVPEFERAFAEAVGAEHAIAVSSGTTAIKAAPGPTRCPSWTLRRATNPDTGAGNTVRA